MSVQEKSESSVTSLKRAIELLQALSELGPSRISDLARHLGYTQATTHRLLQQLAEGDLVSQSPADKRYALGLGLATMATHAVEHVGHGGDGTGGLKALCRPVLARLGAALGESIFLFVRSGFDAVCLDRWEGQFPIRTLTGDVGGRVPLGGGQGAMAILAHLAPNECEEILRYNVPRLMGMGTLDGVHLRAEIARTRKQGYSAEDTGVIAGVAAVAVPVWDAAGHVVAALSVATLSTRLSGERLSVVLDLLKKEAALLSPQINPFDRALRRSSKTST
jgi:DNA-binding IclR family transcriptional regulator